LFNRAIMQSPSTSTQTLEEAERASRAVATLLGVAPTVEAMKSVPIERCISAVNRLADDPALRQTLGMSARQYFPLRPVVDAEVLTHAPIDALAARQGSSGFSEIDILVGSNLEEMRLYLLPNGMLDEARGEPLRQFADAVGWSGRLESHYLRKYANCRPGELLCAMQSDYFYREPARLIAHHAAAAGCNAFLYEFEWQSRLHRGRLGAAHGLEVPFVFDQIETPAGREITGAGAPSSLAATMHEAWACFVRSGLPGWPTYSEEGRTIMRFAETSAWSADDYPLPPGATPSPRDADLNECRR
jgi:para-nitrobenzyl esterase